MKSVTDAMTIARAIFKFTMIASAALWLEIHGEKVAAADSLLQFSDPLPPALYRQFRDRVIITGKCQAYEQADTPDEQMKALNACWLDFIAPRS
jgi:hypothetical protein